MFRLLLLARASALFSRVAGLLVVRHCAGRRTRRATPPHRRQNLCIAHCHRYKRPGGCCARTTCLCAGIYADLWRATAQDNVTAGRRDETFLPPSPCWERKEGGRRHALPLLLLPHPSSPTLPLLYCHCLLPALLHLLLLPPSAMRLTPFYLIRTCGRASHGVWLETNVTFASRDRSRNVLFRLQCGGAA